MLKLKVLDKYLIRNYLNTVFFSLLIFSMISCAIDFSDKVQSIIEKPCTWKDVMAYYMGFVTHMASLLLPLYTLIGVVFFTSRLASNAEILSVFNAGIGFNRLMRPYLVAASAVMLLHLGINHFGAPMLNKWRLWFEHTFVWTDQDKGKTTNVHLLINPNTKLFVRGYNKNSKTLSGLRLERIEGTKVVSILEAESARWKAEPDRWEIPKWSVRTFDGLREKFIQNTTPLDTAINISPSDFVYYANQREEMTTPQLMGAIDRDRGRGLPYTRSYEVEMHRRTADAFTILILTIIGLAVAGRKVRGGMGLHLAVGIGIGAAYIVFSKFTVSFATGGSMPVWLGMWLPNITFAIMAWWLVSRAQK
ncbi:MAG TPA: LptF/LptG family permease [Saprospiraceae bacterium]|nr:LptF/LptG family permease [Saprospiraceae bacterium]